MQEGDPVQERYRLIDLKGDLTLGIVVRAYDMRRQQEVVLKFAKSLGAGEERYLENEGFLPKPPSNLSLATMSLRFHMSCDGDHVGLDIVHECGVLSLGTKTRFDVLAHLAQVRWRDAQNPTLPEVDQGWYDMQDLMRHVGKSERYINVLIHRIRQVFSEAGVEHAGGIVERRPKQLRLGTGRILGFGEHKQSAR